MTDTVTLNTIREKNKTNIVKTIIQSGGIMRSELAKKNRVSVMTVKKIVDDLLEKGVLQQEIVESMIGRKPQMLRLADHLGLFVCISLTSPFTFRYVVYNVQGKILDERKQNVDRVYSYERNLRLLMESVRECISHYELEPLGIAVSVPGAYYEEDDMVNYDLISGFHKLPLKRLFQSFFDLDNIIIVHDVYVSAQAEYDSLRLKQGSLFYFYVGDGVGGAFIKNGIWHTGETLVAGEIGQFVMTTEGPFATLEDCVSVPNMVAKASEIVPVVGFEDVMRLYNEGHVEIRNLVDEATLLIAQALYNLHWVLNPRYIVVNCHYKQYAALILEKSASFFERLKTLPIRTNVDLCRSQLDQYGEMEGSLMILIERWIDSL
jgi:predicted NBD/HSP70 family sugar kinase